MNNITKGVSNRHKGLALLLALASLTWASAQAHTPYLAPTSFVVPKSGLVTLDASFADRFFVPEVAFDQSTFTLVDSSGATLLPQTRHNLKTRVVLEHTLPSKGTYRFSSGQRYGAVFKIYELNGERRSLRGNEPLPEGATLVEHFQSITLAETYLTHTAPDSAALKPYNKGLELVAVTHPNDIYQGEAAKFTLLFNGKPLAGQTLDIFKADGSGDSHKPQVSLATDKQGSVEFTLQQPAVYLAQVRYRHPAPQGAAAPAYSYTYTLTFPVNAQ